jgi:hypothetical protein
MRETKRVFFPGKRSQRHVMSGKTLSPGYNDLPVDLADQLLESGLVLPEDPTGVDIDDVPITYGEHVTDEEDESWQDGKA